MLHALSKEELIAYAKPYLKASGFKKKNTRWTKDIGEFTLCFYIQGSRLSKEDYDIRPGIFVNALMPTQRPYGHWNCDIAPSDPQEIMEKFENWCDQWTNKALIKQRLLAFQEWEKRNPLEKRRANQVDYHADPVPAREFFMIDSPSSEPSVTQYILNNF